MKNIEKAEILAEALPYIQKYCGRTVVVKYGGNAMKNADMKKSVMRDVVLLTSIGVRVVLVHGGGPEINETLKKMGIRSEFVNGLRKTDKETMNVVQMVLAGKIGKDLVGIIETLGGVAVGICGIDGNLIKVRKADENLGYVGDITEVNVTLINQMLDSGIIPVVSTIGVDGAGDAYNINADTAAARLAGELKAVALINMTDAPGLLRDKNDENTLITSVSVSEVPELIKEGVVEGGMLPKVKSAVEAIRRGAKTVFVIDGKVPHAIIMELLSDEGLGTMFY
jgi:acetylglutamate kinase